MQSGIILVFRLNLKGSIETVRIWPRWRRSSWCRTPSKIRVHLNQDTPGEVVSVLQLLQLLLVRSSLPIQCFSHQTECLFDRCRAGMVVGLPRRERSIQEAARRWALMTGIEESAPFIDPEQSMEAFCVCFSARDAWYLCLTIVQVIVMK